MRTKQRTHSNWIIESPPVSAECVYRLAYTHKDWAGKPNPSGFGRSIVDYATPSGLADAVVRATRNGHKIHGTWRWHDCWVRM